MEVDFRDNGIKKVAEDAAVAKRKLGADMSKKFMLRIAALRAAANLAVFWPAYSGPERCHELKGELAGTFSFDLKQPFRLLFIPAGSSPPIDGSDEKKRWESITSITITAIEDTHG